MEPHLVQLVPLSLHNLLLSGSRSGTGLGPNPKITPDYCSNKNRVEGKKNQNLNANLLSFKPERTELPSADLIPFKRFGF